MPRLATLRRRGPFYLSGVADARFYERLRREQKSLFGKSGSDDKTRKREQRIGLFQKVQDIKHKWIDIFTKVSKSTSISYFEMKKMDVFEFFAVFNNYIEDLKQGGKHVM
jgi:hypothetical protein